MEVLRILAIASVAIATPPDVPSSFDVQLLQTELRVETNTMEKVLIAGKVPLNVSVLDPTSETQTSRPNKTSHKQRTHLPLDIVASEKTAQPVSSQARMICVVGVGLLIALFVAVGGKAAEHARLQGADSLSLRLHAMDNARFFAIASIVYGHFMTWPGHEGLEQTLMKGDHEFWHQLMFEPFIHDLPMCGFAVISGFLSREGPTFKRLWTLFHSVILVQIIYVLILTPRSSMCLYMELAHGEDGVAAGLREFFISGVANRFRDGVFHTHDGVDWYLQFLASARLLSYASKFAADKTAKPRWPYLVGFTFTVAYYLHTYPSPYYSFARLPEMLPPFVVGVLFPLPEVFMMIPQSPAVCLTGWAFVVVYVLLTGVGPWGQSQVGVFLDSLPFRDAENTSCIYLVPLFKALVGAACFLVVLITICPREEKWFTHYGTNSLFPYLLHPAIIGLLLMPLIPLLPVVTSSAVHLVVQIFIALVAALITVALATHPIVRLFTPFFKPSCWLDPVVDLFRAPSKKPLDSPHSPST